jgi:squalene cyclase
MIALRSLGAKPPRSTARFLLSTRGSGGWNFSLLKTGPDDVTHTALAIMGLRAAGVTASNPQIKAGVKWMLTQRSPAGGFAHLRTDRNEANATALALEAEQSIGRSDKRAAKALRSLQRSDGAFQFTATDSGSRGLATVDAVVALAGKHLPVADRSKLPAGC